MANKKKKGVNSDADTGEKSKSSLKRAMNASKAADAKRRSAAASAGGQTEKKGGWGEYFKGVKLETKKVVWPTRQELVSYTIVVLFTCAFFGLMIWGVDTAFLAALKQLIGITY
ncbi:MAG: preprotein translocase subunit SecE [Clostridiales Family XIII bacterium]|jgi:preprotein translocase subunit SecE|nr:preprotein translocase subunit SecE [Clostridiales Family XIII bacterium]